MINNHNYKLKNNEEAVLARITKLILKMGLNELELNQESEEHGYFEIDTENPNKLNSSQKILGKEVYGQDFAQKMKWFSDEGIKNIRIYTLMPNYVKEYARNGAIARAGFLCNFEGNSDFFAISRNVNNPHCLYGFKSN